MAAMELYKVRGALRIQAAEACPAKLVDKKATLKSQDGFISQIPIEAAWLSATIRDILLKSGIEDEITLPLQQSIISKLLEYMNYHVVSPAMEICMPLEEGSLADSGASKWDVGFISVDRDMVLDLILASSMLGIKDLFFLACAKLVTMTKGKEGRKIKKDFGIKDDLPEEEQETLSNAFNMALWNNSCYYMSSDDPDRLAAPAVTLAGVLQAAENLKVLETQRDEDGVQTSISLKSYRHALWRVVVLQDWKVLEQAPEEVTGDRDLILAVLSSSQGRAIRHASDDLRADGELMLEAIKYYAPALREVVEELLDDRDFVLMCVVANGEAMQYAETALRADRSFILEAAKKGCGSALSGGTDELKEDVDFVLQLIEITPEAYAHAAKDLKESRDFALRAARVNGLTLQYMSWAFRADRQIVATAVTQDEAAVLFSHVAARADQGIKLPWDPDNKSQVTTMKPAKPGELPKIRTGEDGIGAGIPLNFKYGWAVFKAKMGVQFSASNTLQANMGQANYIASNCFLDKIPFYQRMQLESVTMMWGAVGNIGMRLKAFGSQDFMNATPEAQTTLDEARKMLYIITNTHGLPEWFNEQMYDPGTRAAVLSLTAGGGTGGGWRPGEDASIYLAPGAREALRQAEAKRQQEGDSKTTRQCSRSQAIAGSSPLSSWPGLQATAGSGSIAQEGARVRLVGMRAKNGSLGTLVRQSNDGRWKIQLDGHGLATLKSEYFQVLSEGVDEESLPPLPEPLPSSVQQKKAAAAVEPTKAKIREAYYIVGTWSNWSEPQEMIWSQQQQCWKVKFRLAFCTESFQILLDGSWDKCLHPSTRIDGCPSTEYALSGPSAKGDCRGLHWTIGSHPSDPGVTGTHYELKVFVKDGQAEKLVWERLDGNGKTCTAAPSA